MRPLSQRSADGDDSVGASAEEEGAVGYAYALPGYL